MKTLLLLTTLLTAVTPTGDPLSDLYLRQFLGINITPKQISKNFFHRQVEFNTKFLATVVGPENMVSGNVTTNKRKKTMVSYSVHASPLRLKEKLATMAHFTRKMYPMGYKVIKIQWTGKNDIKVHMSRENKSMVLYFKYNEKHKLFNVWMK
jgi:hypothetical protein|tara:strand:+ start:1365 stop:1820 length:456 start_codon:yes stop_codon:yes gene_type:complete